jgi:hypothetical protein
MAQPLIIDYKNEDIETVHNISLCNPTNAFCVFNAPIEKDPKECQDIEDSLLASVLQEPMIDQWQKDIQSYHLSLIKK